MLLPDSPRSFNIANRRDTKDAEDVDEKGDGKNTNDTNDGLNSSLTKRGSSSSSNVSITTPESTLNIAPSSNNKNNRNSLSSSASVGPSSSSSSFPVVDLSVSSSSACAGTSASCTQSDGQSATTKVRRRLSDETKPPADGIPSDPPLSRSVNPNQTDQKRADKNPKGDDSGSNRDFVTGFPHPPFYYLEYEHGPETGRPPPKPVTTYVKQFNNYLQLKHKIEPLDSDTKLYNDHPSTDLRDEFQRLYQLYVQQIFLVFDVLYNCRDNDVSAIKHLVKINVNMCHILMRLRRNEAAELVIQRLRQQLQQREKCIEVATRALEEYKTALVRFS